MLARQEHSTSPLRVVSQAASTSPEDQPRRPNTVTSGLTPKCPRRLVKNDEYEAFILRTYARGCSWAEIGARLSITRQATQQRWAASSAIGSMSLRPRARGCAAG